MGASLNIFQVLILIGAINGVTWAVLLFINRANRSGSTYLAFFLFAFALGSIKIVLQEKIPSFNRLLPVPLLFQFTFGPLLYLYLKASLTGRSKFKPGQLWHFAPSILFDVLPAILLFCVAFNNYQPLLEKLSFFTDILACISFTAYWLVCRRFTRHKSLKEMQWVNKILSFSFFIIVSWLLYIISVITLKGKWLFGIAPYYPIYILLCLGMYGIGVFGYYRPEVGLIKITKGKKKKLVPGDDLTVKKNEILFKIKEHAWHHDEGLSLQKLAALLQLPVNDVSYIINNGFGVNFNDFINTLRVEDIKQMLLNPLNKKYTIVSLALQVGFNSKASFYRAFKKATNKTPAEFIKQRPDFT